MFYVGFFGCEIFAVYLCDIFTQMYFILFIVNSLMVIIPM
jgi:hypothetical protein